MTTPPIPASVPFDWHCANAHGGLYYASLVRDGIRLHVTAVTLPGAADPCYPSACWTPGVPVVKVTATASAGDPTRTTIGEASASIHARLVRPAAAAVPWHGDRATALTDFQVIADCAADQVVDAVGEARLRLGDLVKYAAGLGITATAAGEERQ